MKTSFHNKIFIWLAIPFLILTSILILIIRSYYISQIKELFYRDMLEKTLLIKEIYSKTDEDALKDNLKEISRHTGTRYRLTVIKENGEVIFDSEKDSSTMENHKNRPEIQTALKDGIGYSERYSHTLSTDMAYLAIPFFNDNIGTREILRISVPLIDINEKINRIIRPILIYAVLFLILTYIILYLILLRFIKPIDDMVEVAKKINSGDLSARLLIPPDRDYEILYNTINDMLSRLQGLIYEQMRQKEEIYSIISSLNEGLVIVNRDLRVLLTNESFARLLNLTIKDTSGKFIYELIKSNELIKLINNTIETKSSKTAEIDYNSTSLYINSSYNKADDTVILLIYNISRIKNLEIYKRDLILNISHELKTPLTAIIGFTDTLYEDIEDETKRRYIQIIKDHATRLMNIVNDLSDLSAIERGIKLEISDGINLNELIKEILPIYISECSKKDLRLITEFGDLPPISCDKERLQQAIINLIDNAIKYTDKGEIRIITGLSEDRIKITVEDTGIGIPETSLNRIFERFYVVDKSRSRKTGGTGLGLSIVKHIIERHNGIITVESKVNQGSRFTILLPQKLTESLKIT